MNFKKETKNHKTYKDIKLEMWKNNILGFLIIIIIIFIMLDVGYIMSRILKILIP